MFHDKLCIIVLKESRTLCFRIATYLRAFADLRKCLLEVNALGRINLTAGNPFLLRTVVNFNLQITATLSLPKQLLLGIWTKPSDNYTDCMVYITITKQLTVYNSP